jgi:putative SOS response-associated peptidase YedK
MYRHGDVLLMPISNPPTNLQTQPSQILAWGEITGHSHRIAERGAATVYRRDTDTLFLHITTPRATLVHEEHQPIVLEQGWYRVWFQREYSPQAIRRVVD